MNYINAEEMAMIVIITSLINWINNPCYLILTAYWSNPQEKETQSM